jgi:hypothetical protein
LAKTGLWYLASHPFGYCNRKSPLSLLYVCVEVKLVGVVDLSYPIYIAKPIRKVEIISNADSPNFLDR